MSGLQTGLTGLVSFALLVVASWCVGEGGEILGEKFDASIVGGLLIAWLNTAPEAIFFITALTSDNPRFAMGAVSGSAIVVCTVAVGACIWIGSNARASGNIVLQKAIREQAMILAVSVCIPALTMLVGFSGVVGLCGMVFYSGFILYSLTRAGVEGEDEDSKKRDAELEDGRAPDIEMLGDEDSSEEEEEEASLAKGVLYLVAGGALIGFFSNPFIGAVVEAASLLSVSPTLLAFFLAPIASEMPEILEAISLSRKGHSQTINIAYSNLVGGTISKTTLLVGIFSFFGVAKGFDWESPNYTISLALLSACALAAAAVGFVPRKQASWHGLLLFGCFVVSGICQYAFNSTFQSEGLLEQADVVG